MAFQALALCQGENFVKGLFVSAKDKLSKCHLCNLVTVITWLLPVHFDTPNFDEALHWLTISDRHVGPLECSISLYMWFFWLITFWEPSWKPSWYSLQHWSIHPECLFLFRWQGSCQGPQKEGDKIAPSHLLVSMCWNFLLLKQFYHFSSLVPEECHQKSYTFKSTAKQEKVCDCCNWTGYIWWVMAVIIIQRVPTVHHPWLWSVWFEWISLSTTWYQMSKSISQVNFS